MKKILKLSNEQAQSLYIILSQAKDTDRVKNRARWKFLEVIEEPVFKFEKRLRDLGVEVMKERKEGNLEKVETLEEKSRDFSKEMNKYTWNDREIFAEAKALFELAYNGDSMLGRLGRMYKEIEDAFMDVKETE